MDINGLAAIVTGGGSGLGAETARQLAAKGAKVALLDVNKDGEISPAELRTTFNGLNDAALLQVLGLGESDSDAVFNAIDANGDGEITKAELAAYLEQQGHPASIADSIFNTLDENADGAISRDELHDGYMTYSGLRSLLMPGS